MFFKGSEEVAKVLGRVANLSWQEGYPPIAKNGSSTNLDISRLSFSSPGAR